MPKSEDKYSIRRQLRSFPTGPYRPSEQTYTVTHHEVETELKPEDHELGVWNAVLLDLERWPDAK